MMDTDVVHYLEHIPRMVHLLQGNKIYLKNVKIEWFTLRVIELGAAECMFFKGKTSTIRQNYIS